MAVFEKGHRLYVEGFTKGSFPNTPGGRVTAQRVADRLAEEGGPPAERETLGEPDDAHVEPEEPESLTYVPPLTPGIGNPETTLLG